MRTSIKVMSTCMLIPVGSEATMSSIRALLCDLCVILVFGLTVAEVVDLVEKPSRIGSAISAENSSKGNCTCGGFPSIVIEKDSQPLLAQSPGLVVQCTDEGESTCKQLCIALATAAKAKGPEVLCIRLKNAEELKLSAFSKICDRPWMYADMTADAPLCCADTKVQTCASAANTNATDVGAAENKTVL